MINFIKNLDFEKLLEERIKPLGIAAACFMAVFAAGFGVGKNSNYSNYTTNTINSTNSVNTNSSENTNDTKDHNNTITNTATCNIKGSKSKIYHIPGGTFYNRTTAAVCFNTEEEAQAAGYTKSSK